MRVRTLVRTRTMILAVVLALSSTMVAATAIMAAGQDRSVTRSGPEGPNHPIVDNTSRTTDLAVSSTSNVSVVAATVALGTKSHGCEVSASAEVERTTDGTGTYVFSIGLDGTTSTVSSERRIEFVSTADTDVIWEDATTTQGYDNLSGSHTFNLLVRRSSGVNTTVTNATITLVCTDAQL